MKHEKIVYFNMRGVYGVETVDQCVRSEWNTEKEFRKEVKNILLNTRLAGMPVYISQKCTNDWKNKQL